MCHARQTMLNVESPTVSLVPADLFGNDFLPERCRSMRSLEKHITGTAEASGVSSVFRSGGGYMMPDGDRFI